MKVEAKCECGEVLEITAADVESGASSAYGFDPCSWTVSLTISPCQNCATKENNNDGKG